MQEIDEALLEWGMPMGPLRLIDEIGVDIAVDIAKRWRTLMANVIAPRKFSAKCNRRKCSAENPVEASTNTKANSKHRMRKSRSCAVQIQSSRAKSRDPAMKA